jgi:hypothetical protein
MYGGASDFSKYIDGENIGIQANVGFGGGYSVFLSSVSRRGRCDIRSSNINGKIKAVLSLAGFIN